MRHARRGPRAWPTKVYRWTESNLHFATAVKDRRGPKMNYNWMCQGSLHDRFEVRDQRLPSRAMAWTTHSSAVVAILSSRVSLMEPPRKQQSPQQSGLAPEARAYGSFTWPTNRMDWLPKPAHIWRIGENRRCGVADSPKLPSPAAATPGRGWHRLALAPRRIMTGAQRAPKAACARTRRVELHHARHLGGVHLDAALKRDRGVQVEPSAPG